MLWKLFGEYLSLTICHGILAVLLKVGLLNVPLCQWQTIIITDVAQSHHLHLCALITGHKHHLLQLKHLTDDFRGIQFIAGAQVYADPLRLTECLIL